MEDRADPLVTGETERRVSRTDADDEPGRTRTQPPARAARPFRSPRSGWNGDDRFYRHRRFHGPARSSRRPRLASSSATTPCRDPGGDAAHDGTVVDRQGDGSMLAFSSARRAVSFANSIQRRVAAEHADVTPPLRVRIGIHTGDALREGEQFFGTTVHYAARVAGHALGGEILVSSVVRDLVSGSDLTFLEGKRVELKGIDGVHRLFAVDPEPASSVS